jgi:hypothetical protein
VNIGGALGSVGQKTLNHYQWGQSVVNIVNSHLKDDHVTVFNSGIEVTSIILTLDDDIKNNLLNIDIGPLYGSMSIEDHNYNNTLLILTIMTGGMTGVGFIVTYVLMAMTDITILNVGTEDSENFLKTIIELFKAVLELW